jgi:hypothetical protein
MLAGVLADIRSFNTSALLGSAFLSSWGGDFWTSVMRSRFANLPVWDTMKWYFRFMNPANKDDVRLMMRAGFVNDAAARMAYVHARVTGLEAGGSRVGKIVSDVVLRASLLNWHTQSARFATAAEFMGALADWRAMPFDEVPGRRVFDTHGITSADWDAMRATPLHQESGHTFLVPDDYIAHSGLPEREAIALADKFMVMIQQEAKMATPDATIAPIVAMRGATRSGTLIGEIANSFAMFRNFPLTLMNTHIRAGMSMPTMRGKIGYLASTIIGLTVMGGVGQQMYEVARGRDPLDMTSAEFAWKAVLRGGGLSIFGDVFNAIQGDDASDLSVLVAGPLVGFIADTGKVAIGDPFKEIRGDRVNLGRDLTNYLKRWAPGTNIWYLRKAIEVAIWDNLIELTDKRGAMALQDQARRLKRNTGQDFWWGPGQATPARAPDLSAAVGG